MYAFVDKQSSARLSVLLLLSGVMFLARTISLMLTPLLIALAAEFHISTAVAGQLATATYITWGLVAPLVGPISDTYGRRPVALLGLSLMALGILGSVLAWNYESLFACRLLTGMGGAMAPPNSMAAISDHFPAAQRGRAIGWLFGSGWLGAVLGVPAVGLLATIGGWRLPLYALVVLILVVWGLLWVWFPPTPYRSKPSIDFLARFSELSREAGLWPVLMTNILQQIAFFALFTYLAAYLVQTYRMPAGTIALVLALVGLGAMLGSVIGGRLAGYPQRLPLIAMSLLGGGLLGGVALSIEASVWATVGLLGLFSILISLGMPVLMTLMTEIAGRSRATAIGLFGASNQVGGVGGASLGGILLSLGGFPLVGLLCLSAAVAAAVVVHLKVRDSMEFKQRTLYYLGSEGGGH